MRNDSFAELVTLLVKDPGLFDELISVGSRKCKRVAELLPEILAARSPPGDRSRRIAMALARTTQSDAAFGEGPPLGRCVDSCEASRLADGPVRPGQEAVDIGAILRAACGGDVTCCCTSGTCGGPTCGGSTCEVTCSGDSCGSTCGDSCGMTSNFDFDAGFERPLAAWDGVAAKAFPAGTAGCGDCGPITCSQSCDYTFNVDASFQARQALEAQGGWSGFRPDGPRDRETNCGPSCAVTGCGGTCGSTSRFDRQWQFERRAFEPQAWRWR